MTIIERSYSGKLFRPKPEVLIENDQIILVATSWGQNQVAKRAIQTITDYFLSSKQDVETTSPFDPLTCITPLANNLRIGLLLANEAIYRSDNSREYLAGLEMFCGIYTDYEFSWIQVGAPHIFLFRNRRGLIPLGSHIDLSFDLSTSDKILPPLPSQMIGLDPTVSMTINSFRPQEGDKIILLCRSHICEAFYREGFKGVTLEGLSSVLASDDPDCPFWLALVEL